MPVLIEDYFKTILELLISISKWIVSKKLDYMHKCAYIYIEAKMDIDLEWDEQKEQSNLRKHGVSLPAAVSALEDEYATTIEDDYREERCFITIGMDDKDRILVVIYTFRGEKIRIISARKATSAEREEYKGANRWISMT
jgi:uncharacterized DUF497 family protein